MQWNFVISFPRRFWRSNIWIIHSKPCNINGSAGGCVAFDWITERNQTNWGGKKPTAHACMPHTVWIAVLIQRIVCRIWFWWPTNYRHASARTQNKPFKCLNRTTETKWDGKICMMASGGTDSLLQFFIRTTHIYRYLDLYYVMQTTTFRFRSVFD